jgi:hypothetical protein
METHVRLWYTTKFILNEKYLREKSCNENQNMHFMFNNFFPENLAFYKIMWKDIEE